MVNEDGERRFAIFYGEQENFDRFRRKFDEVGVDLTYGGMQEGIKIPTVRTLA